MPASAIRTCLWFNAGGLEAAQFYTSLIPNSQLEGNFEAQEGAPPMVVNFSLDGVPFQILNGGPHYTLTEAASIVVTTRDQADTDRLWDALVADGGRESQCGWCKDRFGVSWQIVPARAMELMTLADRAAAGRAMNALMSMKRIDIATLEAAAAAS